MQMLIINSKFGGKQMNSSKKFLFVGIFLMSILIIFFTQEVISQISISSTNYKVTRFTINPAGENISSTNYILHAKLGQFGTNETSSTNYRISFGWFEIIDLPNIFITLLSLNSTTPWYEDPVNATGQVYEADGDPIVGASVTVLSGQSSSTCIGLTNAVGFWSCNFTAPNQLGKYTATAQVSEAYNVTRSDTAEYEVILKYGQEPLGTVSRYVYETPIVIQEPSGNIRIAKARVTVWRTAR